VLRRFVQAWLFNIAAIFLASIFIDGIDYASDFWILVLAGLVFALVNLLVKPLVKLLALPLIALTLGIALFFINMLMLYITSWIVPGFAISSFRDAFWATIIIWAVNAFLQGVFAFADRGKRH
jgi:putative membrane protein